MSNVLVGQAFDNFGQILVVRRLYDKGSRIVLAPLRARSSDRFGALSPDDSQARVYPYYGMVHMWRVPEHDLLRPAINVMASRKLQNSLRNRQFTLDGEKVDVADFIADNSESFDASDIDAITGLGVGESVDYGGGAGASFVLMRIADRPAKKSRTARKR